MDLNKIPKQSGTPDKAAMMQQELANLNRYIGINAEEFDRAAKKREQQEMLDRSVASGQRFAQQMADARGREDAKLDYARRSAEASEEVLAEERRKRGAAEIAAKEAKIDQVKAERRADRNERFAILGLVGMVASLAIAAWPFVRDSLGW